jgi:hypothetical protein
MVIQPMFTLGLILFTLGQGSRSLGSYEDRRGRRRTGKPPVIEGASQLGGDDPSR